MVGGDLVRPQRIRHGDEKIGPQEREVVVAAVPDDHVGLRLGRPQDRRVVDAAEHDGAGRDVRLVFLALLDGAGCGVEVGGGAEALHALERQVAVGHRMPQHRHPQPAPAQTPRQPARDLRLAAAGPHRRDGDDRQARRQHRALRAEQREIGAAGERARGGMHDVLVRHVAVGEHHLVDRLGAADALELAFVGDRDAGGIERPGERGGIAPAGNARNLRRREGDDIRPRVVAIDHVEIVKVAAGRAHDDDAPAGAAPPAAVGAGSDAEGRERGDPMAIDHDMVCRAVR